MHPLILSRNFRLLVAVVSGAASSSPALAASYTWNGAGGNNNWSTGANWGGTAPASATDTALTFAGTTRLSPSATAAFNLASITFDSSAGAFSLSGSALTLTSGGSITNNSTSLEIIANAVTLSGASTWNAASGTLRTGGALSGASGAVTKTGTGTLIFAVNNTYGGATLISTGTLQVGNNGTTGSLGTGGAVTNNGILSFNRTNALTVANAISGTGSVIQAGTGTTTLSGSNSYQGGTTISSGVLLFSPGSLGTGTVTMNGGSLRWSGSNTTDVSGILALGSGGTLDTNGNNVTFASALGGSGPLAKAGTGILTLNAAPANATSVTVNGGTLRSGVASVLPAGVAYTVDGTVSSGSATLDLNGFDLSVGSLNFGGTGAANAVNTVSTGAGTLALGGNVTYTATNNPGTAAITGKLDLGSSTRTFNIADSTNTGTEVNISAAISGAGGINVTGAGVLALSGTNTFAGGITLSGGTLQFSSGSLGSGDVGLNGGTLRWAAGNTAGISGALTLGSSGGTLDTNGNNVTFASSLGGSGPLTKAGAGILTLTGAAPSVTSVTVTNGTLQAGAAGVLPSAIPYTVNATTASGSATLDLNGSDLSVSALTFGGATAGANAVNTISTGAGTLALGGTLTYTATNNPGTAFITGKLDLGSSTRTFNIADSTNTGTEVNISAAISGAGSITVNGSGVLALSGTNTYAGGTRIGGMVVQFSSASNLGTGPVTLTGGNSTLRWAAGNTDDVPGGIIMSGSSSFDTNGNNVSLTNPLSGGGWLYKVGAGTLTVNSAPSLVQAHVRSGTLALSSDNAFPASVGMTVSGTVHDSGVPTILDLNGHDLTVGFLNLSALYSGRNAVNIVTTGSGTLTLGGNLTYAIQGDPYDYYDPGTAVISGNLNLGSSTRTFSIADSFNTNLELNVTANVSGAGGLTKTGAGLLALSGTNTYAGDTILSEGTLRAVLPATSNLQMNGGVFEVAADRTFVYGTGPGQIQLTSSTGGFSAYGGNRLVDIKDTGGTSMSFTGLSLTLSSLAANSTVTFANNIDLNGSTQTMTVMNGSAATDAVLSGVLSNGSLAVTGGGTIRLTGASTYSGGTSITSGTDLQTGNSAPTTVEFASGGLGTGGVSITDGGTLRWLPGNTDGLGGTIDIGSSNFAVHTAAFLDTNGNDVGLNAALSGGTTTFTKIGAGILTLNTPSGYVGYATVAGGTLRIGAAGALGTDPSFNPYGVITVNANTPGGSATFDTNGFNYYAAGIHFGGDTAQANTTNTISTGAGTIYLTTGSFSYNYNATAAADDPGAAFFTGNLNLYQFPATFSIDDSTNTTTELTISANISSTGALGFTKTGGGTLVLSGNNTYTGNTAISQGTLRLAKQASLYNGVTGNWTATKFTVNSGATAAFNVGGTGEFTSANIDILKGLATTTTNGFRSGSFLGLDTTNASGGIFTYASDIANPRSGSNTLGITKLGTGTLVLSGSNTYTGNTLITSGTVAFAKLASLYGGTPGNWTAAKINVSSGATAAFNVGGTGEFTATNITTLKALGGASNGFRSGSFLGLDTTNAGGTFTYSPVIANPNSGANVLGLTKLGTGTLVLSGTNTYTGATTVSAGTLQVDGSIATSATTVNAGAKLQGRGTLGAVTMSTGSTLMAGDNTTLRNLTVGSLLFNANATLQFKLDSSLVQSDLVTVAGQLTLNNTALVLTDLASLSTALAGGTSLTLISYNYGMGNGLGTGTDIFLYNGQSLTEGSTFTVGANTFQINYAVGDPTVTITTVVPEPGTWLLLASGLGLLAFVHHRKRRTRVSQTISE